MNPLSDARFNPSVISGGRTISPSEGGAKGPADSVTLGENASFIKSPYQGALKSGRTVMPKMPEVRRSDDAPGHRGIALAAAAALALAACAAIPSLAAQGPFMEPRQGNTATMTMVRDVDPLTDTQSVRSTGSFTLDAKAGKTTFHMIGDLKGEPGESLSGTLKVRLNRGPLQDVPLTDVRAYEKNDSRFYLMVGPESSEPDFLIETSFDQKATAEAKGNSRIYSGTMTLLDGTSVPVKCAFR